MSCTLVSYPKNKSGCMVLYIIIIFCHYETESFASVSLFGFHKRDHSLNVACCTEVSNCSACTVCEADCSLRPSGRCWIKALVFSEPFLDKQSFLFLPD